MSELGQRSQVCSVLSDLLCEVVMLILLSSTRDHNVRLDSQHKDHSQDGLQPAHILDGCGRSVGRNDYVDNKYKVRSDFLSMQRLASSVRSGGTIQYGLNVMKHVTKHKTQNAKHKPRAAICW